MLGRSVSSLFINEGRFVDPLNSLTSLARALEKYARCLLTDDAPE